MSERTKSGTEQVILHLSKDVVGVAEEAVAVGLAKSPTAFIEDAVRARSREIREARLEKLAEEAMQDPGFVADMRETMVAFETASADGLEHEGDPQLSVPKAA